MARRLIYRSLFHCEEFRALPSDLHRLAVIVLLVNTDDWGRGRSTVLTSDAYLPPEIVREACNDIERTGIIHFYGPRREYFYAPKFFIYQQLRRRQRSTLPAPPDDAFLKESTGAFESMMADRRQAAERMRRYRKRGGADDGAPETSAAVLDEQDITVPAPAILHHSEHGSAPIDLPPALRDVWSQVARQRTAEVATRAWHAAQRWFPVPTAKQYAQVVQAAQDAKALGKPAEEWPDFRHRLIADRSGNGHSHVAGGTDAARRAKLEEIDRRAESEAQERERDRRPA